MKYYKVTLYSKHEDLRYSYLEIAKTSKEAKEKAKLKTNNQVISARVMK